MGNGLAPSQSREQWGSMSRLIDSILGASARKLIGQLQKEPPRMLARWMASFAQERESLAFLARERILLITANPRKDRRVVYMQARLRTGYKLDYEWSFGS